MNEDQNYWTRAMQRRISRRSVIIGGLGLAGATMIGCGSNNGGTTSPTGVSSQKLTPKPGGQLTFAMWAKLNSLDAHMQVTSQDFYYSYPLYDNLIAPDTHYTPAGRPDVSLASSWEFAGNTIIFKLRQGVKFHDGTDVNAQAVKFNIERQLDPKSNSRTGADIRGIQSVDVVDDYTARLNLKEIRGSLVNFIERFNGQLQSPTAIQKYGAEYAAHPTGAGPFQLLEHAEGAYVKYKKFDGYWKKGFPYLDNYTIKVQPDAHSSWASLRNGELDGVFEADYVDASEAKKDSRFTVFEPDKVPCQLVINHLHKPFDDVKVRQAMSYAFDRESFCKSLFAGFGSPATQPVNPECWAYDPSIKGYGYDLAKAKSLMTEAGLADGVDAKTLVSQGADTTVAQAVAAALQKIGVRITFQTVAPGEIYALSDKGSFDLLYGSWGAVADPDSYYVRRYRSGGSYFYTRWNKPDVDKLIDDAAASYDVNVRKPLYQKIAKQAVDEAWEVYLWDVPRPTVVTTKVVQDYANGMVGSYFQPREVWANR